MPKKAGIAFVVVGAALILSALLLLLYNRREDASAGRAAESMLAGVEAAVSGQISEVKEGAEPDGTPEAETLDPELPVAEIDGYEYVGYIEIPALRLKLPVMSEWDYARLKLAPCRQFGSSRTDDLVIAAHNYDNHFGRLKELTAGDAVIFTDMDGIVNRYRVDDTVTIQPSEVEAVQNSGYDLVLYTCTTSGRTRVAVFCSRAPEDIS